MPFGRPDVESLLRQIPRVGFRPSQTHCEPEERFVLLAHQRFKLIGGIHDRFDFRTAPNLSGHSSPPEHARTMGRRSSTTVVSPLKGAFRSGRPPAHTGTKVPVRPKL